MHGTSDCLIRPAQSQMLYNVLAAAGVDATLQLIGGGHGDAPWTTTATLQIVDAFLDAKVKSVSSPPRKPAARH